MIALDIAKRCGYAFYYKETIHVSVVIGDPVQQALKVLAILERQNLGPVIAEDLFKFRNPNTTRNLLRRAGGIEAILLLVGHKIEYVHHAPARSYIRAKSKEDVQTKLSMMAGFELKSDEADAAVLLIHRLALPLHRPIVFRRINLKELKCLSSWKVLTELEKRP